MLVREAELILVASGSLKSPFYSVYGNQLEAGVVDEVLSEISTDNIAKNVWIYMHIKLLLFLASILITNNLVVLS